MIPKSKDILVLSFINIFAIIASFIFRTNFLISALLFLGLPSLYLIYKESRYLKRILLASVAIGLFFGFILDFIAELNKAWDWNKGLFWGKILGVVQVDVMIWFFLWVFHIFLFYEYFIDRKKLKSNISLRQLKVFGFIVLSVVLLIGVYKYYPSILYFNKAYLFLCLLIFLSFLLIFIKKPKLVWRTLPMITYFFFVYLSHEITALHLNQWRFPGDYIGWVHMFGVSFPIEEFVFWTILSSLIGAMYYEVGFDNQKN